MHKEPTEIDVLGAEALPGGLADMHRTLQSALAPAPPDALISPPPGVSPFSAPRMNRQDLAD